MKHAVGCLHFGLCVILLEVSMLLLCHDVCKLMHFLIFIVSRNVTFVGNEEVCLILFCGIVRHVSQFVVCVTCLHCVCYNRMGIECETVFHSGILQGKLTYECATSM